MLPELQGAPSLLEKVIRETQCVCTGTECYMREPKKGIMNGGDSEGIFEEVTGKSPEEGVTQVSGGQK